MVAINNANTHNPINSHNILMGKHVSIILRDDLWHIMEERRGRESKSSFLNHAIETYFRSLEE
tara:strand:- start:3849 stop:4037 length:189 start_codon:yes stop_codon:yes gene_type:complete